MPKLRMSKFQDQSDYQTNICVFVAEELLAVRDLRLGITGK
jgi:hypothetical protein